MPEALISSTTSSGPGVGSGKSISSSSRSPRNTTPFMPARRLPASTDAGEHLLPAPFPTMARRAWPGLLPLSSSSSGVFGDGWPQRLRQRDELAVARHRVEAAGGPVGLGLLDAVGSGGYEIPPDVPRSVHRLAAEQH